MPNKLDGTGLTIASFQELKTQMDAGYQSIYGPNIDLSPGSQDGEMEAIYIQIVLDVENIVATAYAARDINQAVGTQLDTLVNWIQRLGGTFTIQPISITVSQALTLYGLDQTNQPVFTVADGAGNQYQLQNTQNIGSPGTNSFVFQAAKAGAVQSAQNTITVPVTVVLGVTTINNPLTYTTLGINQETDAAFRLRALSSTSIASQGFFNSLYSVLKNTPGESTVVLYENYMDSTSPNSATPVPGIPGHCIWAIVQGVAPAATIAQAIYNQRSLGCNMKGAQSYPVLQADGTTFTVFWDNVVTENIFIKFTATSIDGINPPKIAAIQAGLPALLIPQIGATMNINQIQAAVQEIDPNTLVTNAGLSTSSGGSYTNTLAPSAANYQFQVTSPNIIVLPMILTPSTSTAVHSTGQVQFSTLGGFGTLTYSISVNNSGGSINSSTGLYSAGATHPVTDTVEVTDGLSNTATAVVSVT